MSDLITTDLVIDASARVTLNFALELDDGEPIDRTEAGRPASFVMGDGSLLPGFERVLLGLRSGDQRRVQLPAADAFGERNAQNVRRLQGSQFKDIALEPGLLVSFASPEGELPGLVREVDEDQVVVDFNHPLAGRAIWFDVQIVAVERAA